MSTLHRVYRTFAVHHEKSSVPAYVKVSIDHLFVNLESGKIKYRFGKSLELWIQKSVRTLWKERPKVSNVSKFGLLVSC